MFTRLALLGAIFLVPALGQAQASAEQPLIPAGATWKYLDNGSDQGMTWQASTFDDVAWKSGKARLGYGGDGEATVIGFGPDGKKKFATTYFRNTFTVADPSVIKGLLVRLVRDDGAIVYINGKEVMRSNMPAGAVTYKSWASANISNDAEKEWNDAVVDSKVLVKGKNVVAVEVHQDRESSSDVGFDFQLIGSGAAIAPKPAATTPSTGPAGSASSSSFNFDGVKAGQDTTSSIKAFGQLRAETVKPMRELRKALQEGAAAAFARGDSITGRWYLRQDDKYALLSYGTLIPDFMREPPPVFNVVPTNKKDIHFFAFGDWAYFNKEKQQDVAAAVVAMNKKSPFNFGMTTGDNFYPAGIESPRSPRWESEYESQYSVMNLPVYAVLGNHDHYTPQSAASEVVRTFYSKTWKMPATYYTYTAGPAQFFILDTENFTKWQAMWLEEELAKSNATWKIVVAHHDIYSNRTYGKGALADGVIPILKKYNVPVYLNGHYHTLQHHQADGIDYITSGGGGRSLYSLEEGNSAKYEGTKKFAAQANGFAAIDITPTSFTLRFIDETGKEIYKYDRSR